jgi:hypothetical protein
LYVAGEVIGILLAVLIAGRLIVYWAGEDDISDNSTGDEDEAQ